MKVSIPTLVARLMVVGVAQASLTQLDKQRLHDRVYQTALRGPRLRESSLHGRWYQPIVIEISYNSCKRSAKFNARFDRQRNERSWSNYKYSQLHNV
jgi:hypothetical protein